MLEGEAESLRNVNHSLNSKLTSLTDDKESIENVLRTVQFEKSELEVRYEELEKENQLMREEVCTDYE